MSELKDSNGNTMQIPDGPSNTTFTYSSNGPMTTEASTWRKAQGHAIDDPAMYASGPEIIHEVNPESGPAIPMLARAEYVGIVSEVVNGNVMPNIRVLLAEVIGALDASIPNKDQNKAVKHIIRSAFDRAYFDILSRAYPDCNYGQSGGDYAVSPAVNRTEAFSASTSLK